MKGCGRVVLALLLAGLPAGAAVKNSLIRIKILDSETHSVVIDDSGIPKNCDQVNFDAYCHNSRSTQVTNTLLVQEGDKPPYRITCTVDMKFSRCVPLPKGSSFDARREKRGLTVYYADDNGKVRKQLYMLMAQGEGAESVSVASSAGGTRESVATSVSSSSVSAPLASPAPRASSAQAPSASSSSSSAAQAATPAASESQATVRCSFSSTPAGAEITLDGKYVGSTPSVVNVTSGAHAVVISTAGFAPWKRDLTVMAGSELTVNAVLEKVQ